LTFVEPPHEVSISAKKQLAPLKETKSYKVMSRHHLLEKKKSAVNSEEITISLSNYGSLPQQRPRFNMDDNLPRGRSIEIQQKIPTV